MKKYFTFFGTSLILFYSLSAIADPCTSITTIICGTPITFAPASGLGDPNYPATTVCGGTTTQGGLESIYKFIAPSSGTYQFDVISATNANSVEYGYKTAIICNNSGWNCLGIMTASGTIDAINLNAGDSIFILVNARTISITSQTFQINCAIPFACTSITSISCGSPVNFSPTSGLLGDPNYPATTVCGGTTTQGGLESIYKFIAPASGTYQFDVISAANANSVEYGYKTSAPCNWIGWICLNTATTAGILDAINLNAGDSIFILVNARTTSATNQTFQINCAIPFACTSIATISSCGIPITFAPASGLGDPNYPATTVCGGTTTQGGLESIYKFIAPATDAYQLYVISTANSNNVEYGYKTTAPCNWTGWNCLNIMSITGVIDTINLNTSDSVFILVNSRTINMTSQTFKINCLSTTDIIDNQPPLHLFSISPNPFSTQTTLQTDNPFHNATLTVDNCFGQTVTQIKNINGQTVTFFRDNLPSGLYFIRLTEENKIIVVDKLVITDK